MKGFPNHSKWQTLTQQDGKYAGLATETSITYVFFTHRLKHILNTRPSSSRPMQVFSFKGSSGKKIVVPLGFCGTSQRETHLFSHMSKGPDVTLLQSVWKVNTNRQIS